MKKEFDMFWQWNNNYKTIQISNATMCNFTWVFSYDCTFQLPKYYAKTKHQ